MRTVVLRVSVFQNVKSRIQLISITAGSAPPTSSPLEISCFRLKMLLTEQAASQFGLHPTVPVSNTKDVFGGSRKYGSRAEGIRLRVDMLRSLL